MEKTEAVHLLFVGFMVERDRGLSASFVACFSRKCGGEESVVWIFLNNNLCVLVRAHKGLKKTRRKHTSVGQYKTQRVKKKRNSIQHKGLKRKERSILLWDSIKHVGVDPLYKQQTIVPETDGKRNLIA